MLTLQSDVAAIGSAEILQHGVVKSVQRGVTACKTSNGSADIKVNISAVDLAKSVLLFEAPLVYWRQINFNRRFSATLDSSQITFTISGDFSGSMTTEFWATWTVIEFY